MKEKESIKFFVQRSKNVTAAESGTYIHMVRGEKFLKVKKVMSTFTETLKSKTIPALVL